MPSDAAQAQYRRVIAILNRAFIDLSDYSDDYVAGFVDGFEHHEKGANKDGEPFPSEYIESLRSRCDTLEREKAALVKALEGIAAHADTRNCETCSHIANDAEKAARADSPLRGTPPRECQEFDGIGFMHRSGRPDDCGWTDCPTNGVHGTPPTEEEK